MDWNKWWFTWKDKIQKTAEATAGLTGNKIADTIT